MSRRLAVVGDPISHSKSPKIHAAAYAVLGKDFEYEKIQVAKNHLMQFVESLDESWIGLSVTAPLKNEALRLSQVFDKNSEITGASNTLLRTEHGWRAFNTDVFGIQQALKVAGVSQIGKASVIGSGATAMSAVLAVTQQYPNATLYLAARNRTALKALAHFAQSVGAKKVRRVSISKALSNSDLVISSLPAKALDANIEVLSHARFRRPHGVFFDVAYDPWPSQAAKLWSEAGLTVVSGVEMLLWQAIAQVRIFCEGDPNTELFNEAAVMLAMRNSIGLI